MGRIRVVQPEVVLGSGQGLRELDHISDVLRCNRRIRSGVTKRRIVVQPVDHPVLTQVARNVNY